MTATLSHAVGPTTAPLLEETIGATLRSTAARLPDGEALVVPFQDVRMTWAVLDAEVDRVAKALLALGLGAGDRAGIWSPNCAEWVLLQMATARVGVVLVTLNPAYRTHEVTYAIRLSGCKALFSATVHKTSDYRSMVAEIRSALGDLEHVVHIGSDEWAAFVARGADVGGDVLAASEATVRASDPVNIQFTSGTTGNPKGATLSHRNILNNGWFVGHGCAYTDADRVCIPVPFYHCFGMVMGNLACISHGATMVIPAPSFEAAATLKTVVDERCTSLYGVPTMFIAILDLPDVDTADTTSLRTGIMAGSPCPVEVMKQAMDRLGITDVTICYGMTETSPVSTQTAVDAPIDKRVGTVGTVHPHVEVRIIDPASGTVVSRGETGELCTKGYSVMSGYWADPQRTLEAIDTDGWMHTGDLATMDDEGYIAIVGRSKDMIIRGGENISPREIEEFLFTHDDVVDVQVVGVPDARFGEEVMAFVRPRAGAIIDAAAVREFCTGRIAHYKIPRYVEMIDEMPMTVTGKIQKYVLREIAVDRLGQTPPP